MDGNDAWGAVARLGATQHGAVTRAQAHSAGVSNRHIRRMLDSGVLGEPVAGVLVFAAAVPTVRQALWVATHSAGGGFRAIGSAAAWLQRVDGFVATPPIEVIGARGRRPPPLPGLVLRSGDVAAPDRREVDGIPWVGLARTICDIAGQFGRDVALKAIDDFERRGFSLQWLASTAERLHRPGQSGTGIVMRLLAKRSDRPPDSWFERLVEACATIPGLPPWVRQHEVRSEAGNVVARVDLACVPLRLAVEAHSKRFHFGAAAETADQARDDDLATLGWDVRYVGWHAASRTPDEVARTIERVARRRAHDLGVRLPWAA
ncbi:MAG TPA: type IV toxin-antitoxin system AbiEi family antitoxin domain-containing protein [Ilumatobacter sp.]|nr:type IV toxin-antitoxin system AbiEi family antitoxin domain-containing protein [Ilumatobacter sp.]